MLILLLAILIFTEDQIAEFSETRNVKSYSVVTTNKNATTEEKYGPINPYLEVGDHTIVKETIDETTYYPTSRAKSKWLSGNYIRGCRKRAIRFW